MAGSPLLSQNVTIFLTFACLCLSVSLDKCSSCESRELSSRHLSMSFILIGEMSIKTGRLGGLVGVEAVCWV